MAEDAWNSRDPERVALVYTDDTRWRNRAEFPQGREEVKAFLRRKWDKELDYRLIKELWAFGTHRIAVRFAYEWHDDSSQWYRSYGNENWEFTDQGLMLRRYASINDAPIAKEDRKFTWPPRPASGRAPLPCPPWNSRHIQIINVSAIVTFMATDSKMASAVQILSFVSYVGPKPTTSEAIARSLKTNPVAVRRLLKSLESEGLVHLQRGRHGGVGLSRDPADITLGEIYTAIEREDGVLSLRGNINQRCIVARTMQARLPEIFSAANEAVQASLDLVSLASILQSIPSHASPTLNHGTHG